MRGLYLYSLLLCGGLSYGQYFEKVDSKFAQYPYLINSTRNITVDTTKHLVYFIGSHIKPQSGFEDVVLKYDVLNDTLISFFHNRDSSAVYINNMSGFAEYNDTFYVGGSNTNFYPGRDVHLFEGNGTSWDSSIVQPNQMVDCMSVIDGRLYMGGAFTKVGQNNCNKIAYKDSMGWHGLAAGNCFDANSRIFAIKKYHGDLYACGIMFDTCNSNIHHLARWNGSIWEEVPGWRVGSNSGIYALEVFNDKLYVGGWFLYSDGVSLGNCIVSFDGQNWFSPGSGANYQVTSFAIMNNKLYAGGAFNFIGGIHTNSVAVWNEPQWCSIDSGKIAPNNGVALAAIDNKLFIAGAFQTISQDSFYNHAVWTGNNYTDSCGEVYNTMINLSNDNYLLAPNPAGNTLTIQTSANGPLMLSIYAIDGRLIKQLNNLQQANSSIDISDLQSGIYFIAVSAKGQQAVKRFIKQ